MSELTECVQSDDPVMFEVYKKIGLHYAKLGRDGSLKYYDEMFKPDEFLYDEIKQIIPKLVLVDPVKRMNLKKAKEILSAMDSKVQNLNDFLLLKKSFRSHVRGRFF